MKLVHLSFQEVADRSSANSNEGCRAELQWDENEEMILRPNVPYKMHFRLFDPDRYFAPLDQGRASLS